MPTEARGNYLPEAHYLRETKTYLNCNSRMQCMGASNMYDYQHNTTISVLCSVQQFTFTTIVTCHSLGLDQEARLI